MTAPAWFPDWSGRTAVVAGCGPSLKRADLDLCRRAGLPVIAVNHAWQFAPTALVLYACDWKYWTHFAPHKADFDGLRICGSAPNGDEKRKLTDLQLQRLQACVFVRCAPKQIDREKGARQLRWDGDFTANGGNGGIQAANLAARWGARRVLLLGIDADAKDSHFFGGAYQMKGRTAQSDQTIRTWREAWFRACPEFREAGVEVINCNPATKFDAFATDQAPCYRRMTISEALSLPPAT